MIAIRLGFRLGCISVVIIGVSYVRVFSLQTFSAAHLGKIYGLLLRRSLAMGGIGDGRESTLAPIYSGLLSAV